MDISLIGSVTVSIHATRQQYLYRASLIGCRRNDAVVVVVVVVVAVAVAVAVAVVVAVAVAVAVGVTVAAAVAVVLSSSSSSSSSNSSSSCLHAVLLIAGLRLQPLAQPSSDTTRMSVINQCPRPASKLLVLIQSPSPFYLEPYSHPHPHPFNPTSHSSVLCGASNELCNERQAWYHSLISWTVLYWYTILCIALHQLNHSFIHFWCRVKAINRHVAIANFQSNGLDKKIIVPGRLIPLE